MNKHLLAVALCLLPCTSLHAQEGAQTVESAQKFLSIVLPGNGYMGGSIREAVPEAVRAMRESDSQHHYEANLNGEAKIVDANPVSRCTSKMLADYADVSINVRARRYSTGPVVERASRRITEGGNFSAGVNGLRTIGGRTEGFSWSEVKSVEVSGGDVRLMFAGNKEQSTIYLRSEDLAKRVAYAIEFLRTQCDAAASTGF